MFVAAVLARHGVADLALAGTHGITPSRFYRRTTREGWQAPAPRVRIHPDARRCVQRDVLVAAGASTQLVAASGETAAWLHGIRDRPPSRTSVVASHGVRVLRDGPVDHRRARWLVASDLLEVDKVPTLAPATMLLTCTGLPVHELWGRLIDVVHRGLADPRSILERLDGIGPVPGAGNLRRMCERLEPLLIESVFQDEVAAKLGALGYRPDRSVHRIDTADGIGLVVDVPLPLWKVAVEPEGDAFHRLREHRRRDRRRIAAFAGTDWVPVPVDWRDWHLDRGHVLAAVDAAIDSQRRRGIGIEHPCPLRGERLVAPA